MAIGQPGRRTHLVSLWKRLISRRLARQRKPPIWPMPEHLIKSDNAPDDRHDDGPETISRPPGLLRHKGLSVGPARTNPGTGLWSLQSPPG